MRIANPIYKEVIIRVLTEGIQGDITAEPRTFLLDDGQLDMAKILAEFAAWWRLNGEFLVKGDMYHEVAPQLIFTAYLQRVVNGGGFVDREYGVGRGRIDLLVRKPFTRRDGQPAVQQEAMELKVRRDGERDPLGEGLGQLDGYLTRFGLGHGTLLIFDRRPDALRGGGLDPAFEQLTSPEGRRVTLLRA